MSLMVFCRLFHTAWFERSWSSDWTLRAWQLESQLLLEGVEGEFGVAVSGVFSSLTPATETAAMSESVIHHRACVAVRRPKLTRLAGWHMQGGVPFMLNADLLRTGVILLSKQSKYDRGQTTQWMNAEVARLVSHGRDGGQ